jgi:hypothetical protein
MPSVTSPSEVPRRVKIAVALEYGFKLNEIKSITGRGESVAGGNLELWKGKVTVQLGPVERTIDYVVQLDK